MEKWMKRLFKNRKSHNKGFTLIEVIISMTILAMVFIPLMKYFSDSLKHSALTAKRQQATILAQSLAEQLKAGGSLLKHEDTGYEWNVTGYTEDSSTLDSDTGVGEGVFTYDGSSDFDVVLKLNRSKDTEPGRENRVVVYGVDDSQDILAVEREQGTEALFYFMSINYNYIFEETVLDPDFAEEYLTLDQISNMMERSMHLFVDKDATGYVLKLYYHYSVKGLRGKDPVTNELYEDTFDSAYILDVKTAKLTSMYLLYDRMNEKKLDSEKKVEKDATSGKDVINSIKYDTLYVEQGTGIGPTDEPFVLILICQNLEDSKKSPTDDDDYKFEIKASATGIDGTGMIETCRTNILASEKTGNVVRGVNVLDDTITQKDDTYKPLEITIEVYKPGETTDPYIVINTTKGE